MNKTIKKITILCVLMCSIATSRTHCMLAHMLAGKQKLSRHPYALLHKKAALSQPRFRLMLAQQTRFYNAGVEITNADILRAVEETNRKMDDILQEIRKQSVQKPVTTPLSTPVYGEANYASKPDSMPNAVDKYQFTAESDLSCKDLYNMHYGNR